MQDPLRDFLTNITGRKPSPSIVVSFVNNSLSDNVFSSLCSRFATDMEATEYGAAYRTMNAGYRRLACIAYPVQTKEEAFELIGKAFGSVEHFLEALENQRLALKLHTRSLIEKNGHSWLEGVFLLGVCAQAKHWGRKFRLEYQETRRNVTIANDFQN